MIHYSSKSKRLKHNVKPVEKIACVTLGMLLSISVLSFPAWTTFRGANNYAFESVYIPGTNYAIDTLRPSNTDYVSSYSFAARDHLIYGVRQNRYVYGYDTINLTNIFECDLGTYTISPLYIYSSALFVSGADGFIHRIDRTTGIISERIKINDGLVSGILIANGGTNLVLRNGKSATLLGARKRTTTGFSRAAFTINAGLTISGADDGTVTIVTNTTNVIGIFRASNAVTGSIISAVINNTNYISFIDDSGIVYCISTNGTLRWQYTGMSNVIPYAAYYSWANRLIIASASGDLCSLYITNGAVTFMANIGTGITTPPTIVRDRIAVGTTNNLLAIRNLGNGSLISTIALPNMISDEIAVCDRGMVTTLVDGRVMLVRNAFEAVLPPDQIRVNNTNSPIIDLINDKISWRFNHTETGQKQSAYQYEFSTNTDFYSLSYDSGKLSSTNSNITLATGVSDGTYFLRVRTWDTNDRAGLYSTGTNKFYVDRTKPIISAKYVINSVTNSASTTNYISNASFSLIVNAVDTNVNGVMSDISNRCYSTNGTTWYSYVNPVIIPLADGVPLTVWYASYDNAGNSNTNRFIAIRDNTPPEAGHTADPATFPGPTMTFGLTTTAFRVTASDAAVGMKSVFYSIDTAPFSGHTGSSSPAFSLPEGDHLIRYFAEDKLGNICSTNSFQVTIINPASNIVRSTAMKIPYIAASTGYTNLSYIGEHYLIYFNDPVRAGISLETPAPPVMMMAAAAPASSMYISNGGPIPAPSKGKTVPEEPTVPVIMPPSEIIINNDSTAPKITIGTVTNGGIYAPGITPLISVTDDSVFSTVITLNGMAFSSGTPVQKDGLYILTAYAVDTTGNETNRSITFTVDGTAPDITVTGVTNNGSYNRNVTVSSSFSDKNLSRSFATLNGNPLTKSITLSAEGLYIIHAEAYDAAGNTSMKEVRFTIDKTLPIILVQGVINDAAYTRASIDVRIYEDNLNISKSSLALNSNDYITTLVFSADENNISHFFTHIGPVTNEGTYSLTHFMQDNAGNTVSNRVQFSIRPFYPQSNLLLYASFDKTTAASFAKGDSNDYSGVRTLVKGGFISNCVAPGITSGDVVVQYRSMSNISADKGTVSFWVKPAWQTPEVKGNYLFTLNNNPNSLDMLAAHVTRTNGLTFSVKNSQQKAFIATNRTNWWTNNIWTHVSFTWDFGAQTAAMYVNGIKTGSTALSGTPRSDMYWLCFAAGELSGSWQTLKGYMDEARVYDRALSEQEIASLYSFYIPQVTNASPKTTNAVPMTLQQAVPLNIGPSLASDPDEVVFREGTGKE
ncbi:MAG: hypothetical protein HZC28_18520 [Spirochaetes bacterium]|nr:hypothetical protein [Spirochaetota bacterium]